ncbi:MAG: valine--tRNA ligase [Proteobacteria bacterium]|nr:valine--tRNA ligase [Pseudomonadota bacterium]NBX86882.1 valine--tRNA ligase [Pseudomonadota bacterium]
MNSDAVATRYVPQDIERDLAERWERAGCFTPNFGAERAFAVMMPPPNVTGTLHLGHALDNTLPDILVRRARMQGKAALYQPGTDHASIAVHVVLERQWAKEGKSRFDYGREAFLEKAWEWKDYSHGQITGQLRKLGISCDWSNERFTMDPAYVRAVNKAFVELHKAGLIYRGQRLVNWDPNMQTAVSDLEVKHKEVQGNLWHVRYKFAGGFSYRGVDGIEIATTRPETILADGAIAIHPDDERAKDLIGKKVLVPMVNREIEIVADEMVDPAFGSGMVKITAAHDFNDFAFYQRHKDRVNVPLINLLNKNGTMNGNCPEAYRGLDRFAARKKIVNDLNELGQLVKVEKHAHNVGHAERDDTVLEPFLTWQWYVKGQPLAQKCLQAIERKEVIFVNERDAKVMGHWLENIEDWCISRQLWWGHRIPAWLKGEEGVEGFEVRVQEDAPGSEWRQDEDILDTWFSSAMWPFATQGWPQEGGRLVQFYPGAVIMNGRDILPFWDMRMLMMGLQLTGVAPFKQIYTHGLILDEKGQKMSKSKGNVIDPLELIEQFGSDAVRLTMASIASPLDMRMSMGKVEQGRNFCTKLWNAARFLQMQGVVLTTEVRQQVKLGSIAHPVNAWLVVELQRLAAKVDAALDTYEFQQATDALYHFFWGIFCDWYLELAKPLLAGRGDAAAVAETKWVAAWAFEQVLKLLHPVIPFVTEAVWQKHVVADNAFLMMQQWPEHKAWALDKLLPRHAEVEKLVAVVGGLRQMRAAYRIAPKTKMRVFAVKVAADEWQFLQDNTAFLDSLAGVEALARRDSAALVGEVAVVVAGMTLVVPLAELVDVAEERKRLAKELGKLEADVAKVGALLGNEGYLQRAPAEVVAENRARMAELMDGKAKIEEMLRGVYGHG